MARLTTGFEYQPIIAPYAPAPVEEFREALDERSGVFDRNVGEMDKLDILANNIDVLDPDKDIKLAEIDRIRQGLNQVTEMGAENATSLVRATARDFASNQDIKLASEMHAKEMQRQDDIRQMRLKGLTPYDFSEQYRGVKHSPDWTPKVEAAMDHITDARKYVGKIRDKFKDMGLSIRSQVGPDGVLYTYGVTGKGEIVTEEMLRERANDVIDEFMVSPTGGEQYSRFAAFNGQEPREAAFQMLMTAGREQVGAKMDIDYQMYNKADLNAGGSGTVLPPNETDTHEIGDHVQSKNAYALDINTSYFRNKAVSSQHEGIRPIGTMGGQMISFGKYDPSKKGQYDNKRIEEELRPNLEKAVSLANPDMTKSEISAYLDNQFSDSSGFILDRPDIESYVDNYKKTIKELNTTIPVITTDMLQISDSQSDKNFNLEKAEKSIRNNYTLRDFMVLDEKGNVTQMSSEMRDLLKDPKTDFKVHGLYSPSNPFAMSADPDNEEITHTKFFQPYAGTITTKDGKQFRVAVSREQSTGDMEGVVVKLPITTRSAINVNKLHTQAMKNFGNVVEIDTSKINDFEGMNFRGVFKDPPTIRTYVDGKNTVFRIEGKTVNAEGKTVAVRAEGTSAYSALASLNNQIYYMFNTPQ